MTTLKFEYKDGLYLTLFTISEPGVLFLNSDNSGTVTVKASTETISPITIVESEIDNKGLALQLLLLGFTYTIISTVEITAAAFNKDTANSNSVIIRGYTFTLGNIQYIDKYPLGSFDYGPNVIWLMSPEEYDLLKSISIETTSGLKLTITKQQLELMEDFGTVVVTEDIKALAPEANVGDYLVYIMYFLILLPELAGMAVSTATVLYGSKQIVYDYDEYYKTQGT